MSFKERAIALLLIGPAILFVARERIYNSVAGPFDVEAARLVTMDGEPAHRFIRVVRHGQPVHFRELAGAAFHEEEVQATGARHASASFGYLDEGGHRLLVRNADLAETGDSEVTGLATHVPEGGDIKIEASGAPLFLDCNKTGYRVGALLFLVAGVVAIGLGLDQLRRARKAVS